MKNVKGKIAGTVLILAMVMSVATSSFAMGIDREQGGMLPMGGGSCGPCTVFFERVFDVFFGNCIWNVWHKKNCW